jgi:hypothetical protein
MDPVLTGVPGPEKKVLSWKYAETLQLKILKATGRGKSYLSCFKFSTRLTAANFLVFFAFPMIVMRVPTQQAFIRHT